MRRVVMAMALMLALVPGLFLSAPALAQDDVPQCSDFDSYFDAWDAFAEAGGPEEDPYDFDPDGNGWPCEDLPDTPAEAADAPDGAWPREAQDDGDATEEASEEPVASEEPIAETPAPTEEASAEESAEATVEASDDTGGTPMGEDGMPVVGSGPLAINHDTTIAALTLAAMVAIALAGFSLTRTRRI